MTRNAALSRGAKATDNTLSAQFRIKKTKGKIMSGPEGYFSSTQTKYRPYRVKKGKKKKLYNQFIEKQGKRLDTSGEINGIKLAKYIKQQGWATKKKKTKGRKGK